MKEILTIQDIISLKNKNIVDYLAHSLYRMICDIPYPSKLATFVVIENAHELTSYNDTNLTYCTIPKFDDLLESIELIEHNDALQVTEVVIITDYSLSHGFSLLIEDSIIKASEELTKLFTLT